MEGSFIYANGRISGEETTLLDQRMWQMLISSSNEQEAMRLLGDTWYGGFMQSHSMEDCFIKAMESTEDELVELSEDERLVRGILHRRDVRNARYIWKKILSGDGSDEEIDVERSGLIETETLREAVKSVESRDELPPLFLQTLEELLEIDRVSTAEVDRKMDRLAAAVESIELTDINSDFRTFVMTSIEQKNFLTASRCGIDGVSRQEVRKLLLPGGYHTEDEIAGAYQRRILPDLLAETPGFDETGTVFIEALETGFFSGFERECDRMLLELLEKGAFPVFGPSPLAAFVIRREMEISHLRLLLAAKSAGVKEDRLKTRLPRG
ncbi:MAG: V-type ATPase subunit [Candidatus Aegiribacteria sp.]|nr:V-type ATPase subunit [Candidatus Aegiribacteria sp.]